jgi:predicted phage tail protein
MEFLAENMEFIFGILLAIGTQFLKDQIFKNTMKHEFASYQEKMKVQEHVNHSQEARITTNRESIIQIQQTLQSTAERLHEFSTIQRDELKELKNIVLENNRQTASLESTIKGLAKWLERVDKNITDLKN